MTEVKLEECRNEHTDVVDTLILRATHNGIKRVFMAVYRAKGNDYGAAIGWELREVKATDEHGQWWTDVAHGLQSRREVKEQVSLYLQS